MYLIAGDWFAKFRRMEISGQLWTVDIPLQIDLKAKQFNDDLIQTIFDLFKNRERYFVGVNILYNPSFEKWEQHICSLCGEATASTS